MALVPRESQFKSITDRNSETCAWDGIRNPESVRASYSKNASENSETPKDRFRVPFPGYGIQKIHFWVPEVHVPWNFLILVLIRSGCVTPG